MNFNEADEVAEPTVENTVWEFQQGQVDDAGNAATDTLDTVGGSEGLQATCHVKSTNPPPATTTIPVVAPAGASGGALPAPPPGQPTVAATQAPPSSSGLTPAQIGLIAAGAAVGLAIGGVAYFKRADVGIYIMKRLPSLSSPAADGLAQTMNLL